MEDIGNSLYCSYFARTLKEATATPRAILYNYRSNINVRHVSALDVGYLPVGFNTKLVR